MFNKRIYFIFLLTFCFVLTTCEWKLEKVMMVSTGDVSEIKRNSALAEGQIIDIGEEVIQHGHCYGKTPGVYVSGLRTELGPPKGPGNFSSELSNLEAGTRYYITTYLSDGKKAVYGTEISFSTDSAAKPTITTTTISNITQTGASSGGNISDDGGAPVISRGVCWGTSLNPTISSNKTTDGSGTGAFVSNITGLVPCTSYFVRAYATNKAGTGYGGNVTPFKTIGLPIATTNSVTNITNNSAASGGIVTNECGCAITTRGICWSTTPNPTISNSHTTDGNGVGSFNSALTGLTPNTTYYIRAYVTNCLGTAYGNQVSFVTDPATLTDIDGNVYNVIRIGTQLWMKENLKTTKYNDNSSILPVTDNTAWAALTTPAYCWYNNNAATYKATYGALYNWYAVNTGKLCPAGWHVPTDAEWTILSDYLGGLGVAGGKLKEAGEVHWISPNTGATNESGFTALPAGVRVSGVCTDISTQTWWWASTETNSYPWIRFIQNYLINLGNSLVSPINGASVRCLRN